MQSQRGSATGVVMVVVILVVAALGLTLWFIKGKSFPMNLDRIGQGTPTLVFIYDKELVASGEQMASLSQVRDELEPGVLILVADTALPATQQLMREYQSPVISFLLFDGQGQLIDQHSGLLAPNQLLQFAGSRF